MRQALLALILLCAILAQAAGVEARSGKRIPPRGKGLLATEKIPGRGVWLDPVLEQRIQKAKRVRVTVWFEEQLLGDGKAYLRRAKELVGWKRSELRTAALATLRNLSDITWKKVEARVEKQVASGAFRNLERHWIVNGFTVGVTKEGLDALQKLKGVRKVFATRFGPGGQSPQGPGQAFVEGSREAFDPERHRHPWYVRGLLVDKVWKELGVTGKGTLNVVHDFNFLFSPNVVPNVYRNPKEKPDNGVDDDGNGCVDDVHGYNFDHASGKLTAIPVGPNATNGRLMHGFMCAAIICGVGAKERPYELGIAPDARWAGVISQRRLEAAIEWAVLQGADTYSMSFSKPGEQEFRSHRRKVMEHGALCGVFFVSGAGNFAQQAKVPVQMRQPEDIPHVVFSAAGVQRDLSRTLFSSKGPVEWTTEHYDEGLVDKPEVCAFNHNLPFLKLSGGVTEGGLGGNSFAGPMFCGTIALMLSADPDLLPWDLREIITSTAMDVAAKGYDHETGHGLINAYRAVKEVLRRKALREKRSAKRFTGRERGDTLDVDAWQEQLEVVALVIMRLGPKGQAKALGAQIGDVLVSYDGKPIKTRVELQAAKKAAEKGKRDAVPVVLRRGDETIELSFEPGPLGINAGERYKDPVFR
ncbi:MAG: S8 family serine peptidase [Planctomycetota bacterium]|nr:S8 family serine peptidase [Planctomycetota bacterium]